MVLVDAKLKAASVDRNVLLAQRSLNHTKSQNWHPDHIHFILTDNLANSNSKAMLDTFWPIIKGSKTLDPIYDKKVVVGHRR